MSRFPIRVLARPADEVDFSSATTAKRTGPARWIDDGELEIPFDRALTADETEAVTLLLDSTSNAEAGLRKACATYLARETPTAAQNTAQIKLLTRLVLHLIDRRH